MNKFSSEDWEYLQIITHLMEKTLGLDKRIILTTDKKLFNKYVSKRYKIKDEWGKSFRETGLVWLNEQDLAKRERAMVVAVIIHEMLHIKYPNKSESWVSSATNSYIKVHYVLMQNIK